MRHAYPLMLDVTDRLVVLVGGGAVAARKANGLIAAGATRIRCVSPAFDPTLPAAVERVEAVYAPHHLDGASLVFAATDRPEVNAAVVRDARARGTLVNRADGADDGEPGDFATPARFDPPGAVVTVSAGSAALAVLIRDGLAARWNRRWSLLARATHELRPKIRSAKELTARQRAEIFREMATEWALEVVADGGVEALRAWLLQRHPELATVL